MSNTIATYYTEELVSLDEAAGFYADEMLELEAKLTELLHRNTIPRLAENAGHFLDLLSKQQQRFLMIQKDIEQQQNKLKQNNGFIEDDTFDPEIKASQNALRSRMLTCEKEYLDVKYACLDFLSGVISH